MSDPRTHNAANEIRNVTPDASAYTHVYDHAGRLVAQMLPDRTLEDGQTVQQRRRLLTYDAWGRLTRVAIERRTVGAATWLHHQTLAAYTYYAGHQRATRTARRETPPPSGDDDPPAPGGDLPHVRTHYIYDDAWALLEERVEPDYDVSIWRAWAWWGTGQPGEGSSGFFGVDAPAPADLSVRQFLWDPTAEDELILVREHAAPGALVFDRAFLAVTDRRHDVVALAPIRAGAQPDAPAAWSIDAPGVRRVRYSPYGVPEPILLGDLDADGDADESDLAALATLASAFNDAGTRPVDTGWRADADLDASGRIDAQDVAVFVERAQGAGSGGSGSGSGSGGSGGASASASLHLWPNSGSFLDLSEGGAPPGDGGGDPPTDPPAAAPFPGGAIPVGFGAMLYDEHTRLWHARLRWYDPEQGRWLTRDPAGYVDGLNLYQYVRGNPLAYYDPFGLMGLPPSAYTFLFFEGVRQTSTPAMNVGVDATVNFGAGAADSLTFDATAVARDAVGLEGAVDTQSGAYKAGVATETAIELAGTGPIGFLKNGAEAGVKQVLKSGAKQAGEGAAKGADEFAEKAARNIDDGAAARLKENAAKGRDGERQAGIDPDAKKPHAVAPDGTRRYPDAMTKNTLTEVKNREYLTLTKQLRDYAEIAKKEGVQFILKVRNDSRLSGPLQEMVDAGRIILDRCIK